MRIIEVSAGRADYNNRVSICLLLIECGFEIGKSRQAGWFLQLQWLRFRRHPFMGVCDVYTMYLDTLIERTHLFMRRFHRKARRRSAWFDE